MSEYKRGDFDPTDARSALPELEGVFERPPYAPTPLNPYDLKKDGAPYIQSAQEIIDELFRKNLMALETRPPEAMIDLLRVSISSALFRRFDNNSGKTIPADCDDETAELFARACLGRAMPSELVELLRRQPGNLESVELAKQTHPFDWAATAEMDGVIDGMLEREEFTRYPEDEGQNIRYYFNRSDNNDRPSAIIVVRKADLGAAQCGDDSRLTVVQRDSFVLDLIHPDADEISWEFHDWLQTLQRLDENYRKKLFGNKKVLYPGFARRISRLSNFVDEQLAKGDEPHSPAIHPGVRSYYAYCKAR